MVVYAAVLGVLAIYKKKSRLMSEIISRGDLQIVTNRTLFVNRISSEIMPCPNQ